MSEFSVCLFQNGLNNFSLGVIKLQRDTIGTFSSNKLLHCITIRFLIITNYCIFIGIIINYLLIIISVSFGKYNSKCKCQSSV